MKGGRSQKAWFTYRECIASQLEHGTHNVQGGPGLLKVFHLQKSLREPKTSADAKILAENVFKLYIHILCLCCIGTLTTCRPVEGGVFVSGCRLAEAHLSVKEWQEVNYSNGKALLAIHTESWVQTHMMLFTPVVYVGGVFWLLVGGQCTKFVFFRSGHTRVEW